MKLNENMINSFQQKIFTWWLKNKRELPWRKTENPYYIMVSEIMLQPLIARLRALSNSSIVK